MATQDEMKMGLGSMIIDLMDMYAEGKRMVEGMSEDFEIDDASITFTWEPNNTRYEITLKEIG